MLTLTAINTFYGRAHILRDVSLTLKAGECVALLGRNGAGKSTTMKTIIGLLTPQSGEVTFDRKNITGLPPHRIAQFGVGYVPEERRVFPELTVFENLRVGEKTARHSLKPWTIPRVYELFPKLEELKDREAGHLSGGEQQMLTVARTLMGNPKVLLLDEPTEGLAPIIVQTMVGAITQLKAEGLAILIAEQNHRAIAPLCDRAYTLEKGTVINEDLATAAA